MADPGSLPCYENKGFYIGEVVWAKISGYPFWPSVVCVDPVSNGFIQESPRSKTKFSLHVRFYNDYGRRSWTKTFEKYSGKENLFKKYPNCLNSMKNKNYFEVWNKAVNEADKSLKVDWYERIKNFCTLYNVNNLTPTLPGNIFETIDIKTCGEQKKHAECFVLLERTLSIDTLSRLEDAAADGPENPTTDGPENPSTDGAENPSADGHENPSADGAENPSADGLENPSADGAENPITDGPENPSTTVAEKSESPTSSSDKKEDDENVTKSMDNLFRSEDADGPPENLETTVPENLETTVPENMETTVPENTETTVPENMETTVPENMETTVPENIETTVPENMETTVPVNLEKTVAEICESPLSSSDKKVHDQMLNSKMRTTKMCSNRRMRRRRLHLNSKQKPKAPKKKATTTTKQIGSLSIRPIKKVDERFLNHEIWRMKMGLKGKLKRHLYYLKTKQKPKAPKKEKRTPSSSNNYVISVVHRIARTPGLNHPPLPFCPQIV